MAEALSVFQQTICSFYVFCDLESMSKTASINSNFFLSYIATIKSVTIKSKQQPRSLQQLENVLSSWSFKRVAVPGDGNCLFTAVGLVIIQCIQSGEETIRHRLSSLGRTADKLYDTDTITTALQTNMVREWMENFDYYQGFVTTDITAVGHEYLQSGSSLVTLGT